MGDWQGAKSATTEVLCFQRRKESPPLRQFFIFSGLESFLRHFLRNSSIRLKKSAAAQYLDDRGIQWQSSASTNTFARTKAGVTAKPPFIRTARSNLTSWSSVVWRKSIPREGIS